MTKRLDQINRHIPRLLLVVATCSVLLVGLSGTSATAEETGPRPAIEACYSAPYSPDQRLPFSVSQEEWCHPLFKDIQVTTEPGGVVNVSWEPASKHVSWYCGTGYGKQDCPINEYRVETSNYGQPIRCSVGSDGTSCTLRGVGVLYTLPVTLSAYLANGNWFRVHLVVEPCCKIPSPPIGVTAVPVQDALDVSWSPPHHWGGASELNYTVTTNPPTTPCTTTGLACRLEGLSYGQQYTVSVEASNAAGASQSTMASNSVAIETSTPSAPRSVGITRNRSGDVIVRWEEPETSGGQPVTGFVTTASPGNQSCRAKPTARTCTFRDLPTGKTYSFSVQAVNSMGLGSPSAPASVAVKRLQQQPPVNVKAEASPGILTVSWDAPADRSRRNPVRYVVETQSGTASCATTQTTCTLTGLAPGRTYALNVVARSPRGTSAKVVTSATVPVPRVEPPKPLLQIG